MTDLDVLGEVRADVPSSAPDRLARGRARLMTSIAEPARPVRPGRPLPRIVVPVGVLAVAGAVAAVAVLGSGTSTAPVRAQVTLTAQLLNSASTTVAQQQAPEPSPQQWIHTKTVAQEYGQPTTTNDNWIRFDGSQSAYVQGGKLVVHTGPTVPGGTTGTALDRYDANSTPATAYAALASLPTDPHALLTVIDQHVATIAAADVVSGAIGLYAPAGKTEAGFDYLAQLLWNGVTGAPPSAEAAVFRAMAAMPGVSSRRGVTTAAGQQAVGVSANGGKTQLLLDPATYHVVGMRAVSTGHNPFGNKGSWPATAGVTVEALAWEQVGPVAGPGRN